MGHGSQSCGLVSGDLRGLAEIVAKSVELHDALVNPSIPLSERAGVLTAVLTRTKAHKTTRNFLLLLLDNNRLGALSDILVAFEEYYDERIGRVRARVCSATPLDKKTLDALQKHLLKVTGKSEIIVETEVDPSLIGGIVTHVGDRVFDGSIRTQLNLLQNKLLSQETPAQA